MYKPAVHECGKPGHKAVQGQEDYRLLQAQLKPGTTTSESYSHTRRCSWHNAVFEADSFPFKLGQICGLACKELSYGMSPKGTISLLMEHLLA